jgi:hypothetical protein
MGIQVMKKWDAGFQKSKFILSNFILKGQNKNVISGYSERLNTGLMTTIQSNFVS